MQAILLIPLMNMFHICVNGEKLKKKKILAWMITYELEMLPKCSSLQCAIFENSWIISMPWPFQNLIVDFGEHKCWKLSC